MSFTSATLLAIVAVLCALHWASRWQTPRLVLLLAASWLFYGWAHPPSLLLLGASILFNYGWALWLERRRDRGLLALGVALNLSSLVFFKYSNFPHPPGWMPLGISFFTFQVIAYLVDVYRGELKAERSLLVFAVFKSFFAQLIAGPIVRGRDFLPQLRERRVFSWDRFHSGLLLVLIGLFLKSGIADVLGPSVDHAWKRLGTLETNAAWFALYGYSVQLLTDFAGYSIMAVGFGLLFGLELPQNFLHPYGSGSVREFWQRWHVTLSGWLRDYLYIPLGGNRRRAALNRLITMTLGGLWHGSSWNFLLWGFLHGVAMRAEKPIAGWPRWLRMLITFHVVTLLWVFFRAPDLSAAMAFFSRLVAPPFNWQSAVPAEFLVVTAVFLLAQRTLFAEVDSLARGLVPQRLALELLCVAAMIWWLLASASPTRDFIYNVY